MVAQLFNEPSRVSRQDLSIDDQGRIVAQREINEALVGLISHECQATGFQRLFERDGQRRFADRDNNRDGFLGVFRIVQLRRRSTNGGRPNSAAPRQAPI